MRNAWVAFTSVFGKDEAVLLTGVGCLTAGAWSVFGPPALIVPGAILVWLGLPARLPLVLRPQKRKGE